MSRAPSPWQRRPWEKNTVMVVELIPSKWDYRSEALHVSRDLGVLGPAAAKADVVVHTGTFHAPATLLLRPLRARHLLLFSLIVSEQS